MITDIFIKTYPKDYPWLNYCLQSVVKYAYGFRRVVIVTDAPHIGGLLKVADKFKGKLDITCHEVKAPEDNPAHKWGPTGTGYQFQKAVKIHWIDYTDADACFQIDSDCIFTAHVCPENWMTPDGKPFWIREPWSKATQSEVKTWQAGRDHFLKGKKSEWNMMVAPGFLMTREATLGLIAHIKKKFRQNVDTFFLDTSHAQISVYNTFGLYLEQVDHGYVWGDLTHRIPIKQNWSWGGLDKAIYDISLIMNAPLPSVPKDREDVGRWLATHNYNATALEVGLGMGMDANVLMKSFHGQLIIHDDFSDSQERRDNAIHISNLHSRINLLEDISKLPDMLDCAMINLPNVQDYLPVVAPKVKRGGLIGGKHFRENCHAIYGFFEPQGLTVQTGTDNTWFVYNK
jgi:hypothetical protein